MADPSITFKAPLGSEEHAIFFLLPFHPRDVFGKARPPVVVTVNGYSFRSTPAIYDGKAYIPMRASNREAAGVSIGQVYEVTLTLDTAPREVEVPAALADALAANPAAAAAWETLSYTHQREHADAVETAKSDATRTRRVAKTVEMLLAKAESGRSAP